MDLTGIAEPKMEAEESAYQLSVSLANEKTENAKYEDHLQSLVEAGEQDRFFLELDRGLLSPIATSSVTRIRSKRNASAQTSVPPAPVPAADRSLSAAGVADCSLNETLELLRENIKSTQEEDKLFEIKLRTMLIDTP